MTAIPETPTIPELLLTPAAADRIHVGLTTMRDLIRRREVASVKIGRRVLVRADSLVTFIERNTRPANG